MSIHQKVRQALRFFCSWPRTSHELRGARIVKVMPRFVILHHEMPKGSSRPTHWDLMIEVDGALRTWALESPPGLEASINAVELAPHRIDYLQYEGPVTGNRGSVSRWDDGTYEIIPSASEELVLQVDGQRCSGLLSITAESGEDNQRFNVSLRKS